MNLASLAPTLRDRSERAARRALALMLLTGCDPEPPPVTTTTTGTESSAGDGSSTAATPSASTSNGTDGGDESTQTATSGDPTTGDDTDGTSGPGPVVPGETNSLEFYVNGARGDDYGELLELPPTFGEGEFTFEMWARPDESLPVGPTSNNDPINWTEEDPVPHAQADWWFDGNFMLDGHHNGGWEDGSFDLQLYGGGRVRWLFGDGELRGVQAYPAAQTDSILDGQWHHIACVRRADAGGAELELWVDGGLVATEPRMMMVNMRQYWDDWFGYGQPGWMFGAEKGSAYGSNFVEDYKGRVAELRFWSRARSADELSTQWDEPLTGDESDLVGWFQFGEGEGATSCDAFSGSRCMDLYSTSEGEIWSGDAPPLP